MLPESLRDRSFARLHISTGIWSNLLFERSSSSMKAIDDSSLGSEAKSLFAKYSLPKNDSCPNSGGKELILFSAKFNSIKTVMFPICGGRLSSWLCERLRMASSLSLLRLGDNFLSLLLLRFSSMREKHPATSSGNFSSLFELRSSFAKDCLV